MSELFAGCRFTFRTSPAWHFWKQGVGIARVIAIDGDVVHVQVVGVGPTVIAHLPILREVVEPIARGIAADPQISSDDVALHAVLEWRTAHAAGDAGVFSVPLLEAIALIFDTVPDDASIGSAYPVPGEDGMYRTVRVMG